MCAQWRSPGPLQPLGLEKPVASGLPADVFSTFIGHGEPREGSDTWSFMGFGSPSFGGSVFF